MVQTLILYIPGLVLALSVALLAKGFALFIPYLGAPAIAIFLGIFLGNTFLKQSIWGKGTRFSESRLLEYSIVLLGGLITFNTIFKLGISGLLFIMIQMGITLIAAYYIGKRLRFNQSISLMMASGNAVCGSSAIAATAPVIGATSEERGLVITIVNLMGTVLMFVMPILGYFLYQHDTLHTSALIGGTLQSVGQVVASASMVNSDVNEQAIIFKIIRVVFIVAVVLIFSQIVKNNPDNSANHTADTQKTTRKKSIIPWYVYGFLVMCILSSLHIVPEALRHPIGIVSGWFEITALAAIGLRLNFGALKSSGKAFSIYALLLTIVQISAAVILVGVLFDPL